MIIIVIIYLPVAVGTISGYFIFVFPFFSMPMIFFGKPTPLVIHSFNLYLCFIIIYISYLPCLSSISFSLLTWNERSNIKTVDFSFGHNNVCHLNFLIIIFKSSAVTPHSRTHARSVAKKGQKKIIYLFIYYVW